MKKLSIVLLLLSFGGLVTLAYNSSHSKYKTNNQNQPPSISKEQLNEYFEYVNKNRYSFRIPKAKIKAAESFSKQLSKKFEKSEFNNVFSELNSQVFKYLQTAQTEEQFDSVLKSLEYIDKLSDDQIFEDINFLQSIPSYYLLYVDDRKFHHQIDTIKIKIPKAEKNTFFGPIKKRDFTIIDSNWDKLYSQTLINLYGPDKIDNQNIAKVEWLSAIDLENPISIKEKMRRSKELLQLDNQIINSFQSELSQEILDNTRSNLNRLFRSKSRSDFQLGLKHLEYLSSKSENEVNSDLRFTCSKPLSEQNDYSLIKEEWPQAYNQALVRACLDKNS